MHMVATAKQEYNLSRIQSQSNSFSQILQQMSHLVPFKVRQVFEKF